MGIERLVNLGTQVIQASPMAEIASVVVNVNNQKHGKVFGGMEGVVTSVGNAFTAPIWLVKDLLLTVIAGGASLSMDKKAIDLTKQAAMNAGMDAVSPVAALAGIVYSVSEGFQGTVKSKIPSELQSTEKFAAEFSKNYETIAKAVGSKEIVIKLLEWVEKNPKLAVEIAEEIPELKPFAKLLPSLAAAVHHGIPVLGNKNKLAELAKKIQELNTAPFADLALAASKDHLALHGKTLSKIDATLTYAATCLAAIVHIVCNLFLITIAAPASLFSKEAEAFLSDQVNKLKLNIKCVEIAGNGVVDPAYATQWVKEQIKLTLPEGMPRFINEFAQMTKGNLTGTIENGKKLVAFMEKVAVDKALPNQMHLVSKILDKLQESDNAKEFIELLQLFPSVAKLLPKELWAVAPALVKVMGKHSSSVRELIEKIAGGRSTIGAIFSQMSHELKKEVMSLVPDFLKSPETTKAVLTYALENPAVKQSISPEVAKEIHASAPQVAEVMSKHPTTVQKIMDTLASGTRNIASVITSISRDESQVKKDVIDLVPTVLSSPASVEAALTFASKNAEVQKILPQTIIVGVLPKVKDFIELNKQHPEAVKTVIAKALQNDASHKETLAGLAKQNPALGQLAKQLGLM